MKKLLFLLLTSIFAISCGDDGGSTTDDYTCSASNPSGTCPSGKVCNQGSCISENEACSTEFPNGYCEVGYHCENGECFEDEHPCSSEHPDGFCDEGLVCDDGTCIERVADISDYKLGIIGQKIEIGSGTVCDYDSDCDTDSGETCSNRKCVLRPHVLTDTYHYYVVDSNGRNIRQLTTDTYNCLTEYSCFLSPNAKYFLYYTMVDTTIKLHIANVNPDYSVDFENGVVVTEKITRPPLFVNDGKSIIFIDEAGDYPWVVKYDMSTRQSEQIIKFSVTGQDQEGNPVEVPISGSLLLSQDGTKLVYSLDKGYSSGTGLPIEIYLMDLESLSNEKIYEYARQNLSGVGVKYGAITYNNTKLIFIDKADNQHRLHTVSLDGSSFIPVANQVDEEGAILEDSRLGQFVGPDYNSCENIVGTQICDIKSDLFFSADDSTIYFAGKVGQWSELSDKMNLYKYVVSEQTLYKITDADNFNTEEIYKYQDFPFLNVTFNPVTGHAAYVASVQGNIKNNEAHLIDINSTENSMEATQLSRTEDVKELMIKFLKP